MQKLFHIFALSVFAALPAAADSARPNVVFILADDLGYGDMSANNLDSKLKTPNLDRMAAEGVRFTDAHSGSAVCTPTRYGVVTGRYCWRSSRKRGVLNGYGKHLIDPERYCVGDLFKDAGYSTAVIGKWHLGMDFAMLGRNKVDVSKPVANNPTVYGFDTSYVLSASLDFPPYVWVENDRIQGELIRDQPADKSLAYIRAGEATPDFKHVDILGHLIDKGIAWINEQVPTDQPFFLYLPLTSPHKPVMPSAEFVGQSDLGPYGDFVLQTDAMIGRVDAALKDAGVWENTLVMVSSDNGSFMYDLSVREDKVVDGKGHVQLGVASHGYFPGKPSRQFHAAWHQGGYLRGRAPGADTGALAGSRAGRSGL